MAGAKSVPLWNWRATVVSRDDGAAPIELVVQGGAAAKGVEESNVLRPGVDVEIFGFHRPVSNERGLDAAADSPSRLGLADACCHGGKSAEVLRDICLRRIGVYPIYCLRDLSPKNRCLTPFTVLMLFISVLVSGPARHIDLERLRQMRHVPGPRTTHPMTMECTLQDAVGWAGFGGGPDSICSIRAFRPMTHMRHAANAMLCSHLVKMEANFVG